MSKQEIFETVDESGNAIGQYFTTYIDAREAADEMGLSVRRNTIDLPTNGTEYNTVESQEFGRGSHLVEDTEGFVDGPSDGWEW